MTRDNPGADQGSVRCPLPSDRGAIVRRYVSAQLLWGNHTAQRLGLAPVEFAALNLIALEDEVTPGRLSRLMRLSPAAVTRMVDRLVDRGFVERSADTQDRRKVRIVRTPAWQAEIDAAVEPHRAAMRAILGGFTGEQRDAVFAWMDLAAPALRDLIDEGANPTADARLAVTRMGTEVRD